MKKFFPSGFFWGVSTSAFQIEGNSNNSNWEDWALRGHIKDGSIPENACDSEKEFERDLKAMKELNINAYKFSVEWSKIQPKLDEFSEEHIKRYKNWLKRLREENITPFLTFFHFSMPKWFYDIGGFEKEENIYYFLEFVERIAQDTKDLVDFYIIINNPVLYAFNSYLWGKWPPGKEDENLAYIVLRNIIKAYIEARIIIKETNPYAKVGISKNFTIFNPSNRFDIEFKNTVKKMDYFFNYAILDYLVYGKKVGKLIKERIRKKDMKFPLLDFIGIDYFTRVHLKKGKGKMVFEYKGVKNDIGWEIYPQGIEKAVIKFHRKYNLPIIITGNGIADDADRYRPRFLIRSLIHLHNALNKGAKVFGYLHWSLMDSFEWDEGKAAKYGLFRYNYDNKKLEMRASGSYFSKITKKNEIPLHLMKYIE